MVKSENTRCKNNCNLCNDFCEGNSSEKGAVFSQRAAGRCMERQGHKKILIRYQIPFYFVGTARSGLAPFPSPVGCVMICSLKLSSLIIKKPLK